MSEQRHSAEKDAATYPRVAYMDYVSILVHRVLSRHKPGDECPTCPALCHHCGHVGKPGDDHSCPCPYSDLECPHHSPIPPADPTPPTEDRA